MAASVWYPSVEDVLTIHDDILSEYPRTASGVRNRGDIEFALQYIDDGAFGTAPETVHEKAFHLLRLLVANHPFVDANKRTALGTTVVFYSRNGYRLEYDDGIRSILKRFGTDQTDIGEAETVAYLQSRIATDEDATSSPPLDEVPDDIPEELVRRVAAADREENRDIYDALEDE